MPAPAPRRPREPSPGSGLWSGRGRSPRPLEHSVDVPALVDVPAGLAQAGGPVPRGGFPLRFRLVGSVQPVTSMRVRGTRRPPRQSWRRRRKITIGYEIPNIRSRRCHTRMVRYPITLPKEEWWLHVFRPTRSGSAADACQLPAYPILNTGGPATRAFPSKLLLLAAVLAQRPASSPAMPPTLSRHLRTTLARSDLPRRQTRHTFPPGQDSTRKPAWIIGPGTDSSATRKPVQARHDVG